jgi:glycosyltransferase involved in cell wall biosynthesis
MVLICQYYDGYYPASGGIETYISNIIQNLEYDFEIITDAFIGLPLLERAQSNVTIRRFRPYNLGNVSFRTLRNTKPFFPIRALTDYLRLYQKKKYMKKAFFDLFHIHGAGTGGSLLKLCLILRKKALIDHILDFSFLGQPSVLTLHGLSSLLSCDTLVARIEGKFIAQFNNIICVDKNIYTYLLNKDEYQDKKIWFIPNSIDVNTFKLSPFPNKDKLQVGFIGRLERSRGIYLLIELINKLPQNMELSIIGSGNHKEIERFESAIDTSKINFYINIAHKNIPQFLQQIDILFNPVLVEGISRVTLEAMACGRPVIMLDKGDRYPVIHNETGCIVKPKIDEIIEILKYLNQNRDELENMGKRARQIVEREFSNEKIMPLIDEVYKELLKS